MGNKYVLAMYDVLGKQNFIYKSRKCKEIVGGSQMIADVFSDYLYPAAVQYRDGTAKVRENADSAIYRYQNAQEEFSSDAFCERMKNKTYIGEVVYEGGGNFLVLYRDVQTCREVNKRFTRKLLEEVGTLKVLCSYIEIKGFENYEEDRKRLYAVHQVNEAQESVLCPVDSLPFVQVSPENGHPFTSMAVKTEAQGEEKVTTEQKAKYKKYREYLASLKEEKTYKKEAFLLDEMTLEKGRESLLAVIYIDGNSMGAQVEECLSGKKSYDECVTKLREFSEKIDQKYVRERIAAIDGALEEKYGENSRKLRRTIVAAGDEMTVICNARDALDVVRAYFSGLHEGSSCAGIAVFHSHAPYADAYRIAEQACENAKSMMKKAGITQRNLMDFHYCQGGIGISLEKIRNRELEGQLLSRPWRIDGLELTPVFEAGELSVEENIPYRDHVRKLAAELRKLGRSNVKALRQSAESGLTEFEMELERINAHRKRTEQIDFTLGRELCSRELRRRLVYDISIVYDLWFGEVQKG